MERRAEQLVSYTDAFSKQGGSTTLKLSINGLSVAILNVVVC